MAKKLADQTNDATKKANYMSEYYYYLNRAKNYSLLFDDSGQDVTSKWLRGRKTDGSLNLGNSDNNTGFNPFWWGADYTETNAFNMAVSVPPVSYTHLEDAMEETDKLLEGKVAVREEEIEVNRDMNERRR